MKPTLRNISSDSRCDVHQTVLGIREGKEGWFDLYCPGGVACDDDGELYSIMVCTHPLCTLVFRYCGCWLFISSSFLQKIKIIYGSMVKADIWSSGFGLYFHWDLLRFVGGMKKDIQLELLHILEKKFTTELSFGVACRCDVFLVQSLAVCMDCQLYFFCIFFDFCHRHTHTCTLVFV